MKRLIHDTNIHLHWCNFYSYIAGTCPQQRLAQSTAAISQHCKALHLSPSLLIRKLASLALTAFYFEPHSTNVKLLRLILREILFLAITYVTQSEGKHNCLCIFTAHTIASWGSSWGSTIRVLNSQTSGWFQHGATNTCIHFNSTCWPIHWSALWYCRLSVTHWALEADLMQCNEPQ